YMTRDFLKDATRYDVIMDNVGNAPYSRVRHLLKPNGRFLMVIGDLPQMLAATWQRRVVSSAMDEAVLSAGYYLQLMQLGAAGHIRAVIDRSFPFDQVVDAHRLVDSGRKRGSAILTVGRA